MYNCSQMWCILHLTMNEINGTLEVHFQSIRLQRYMHWCRRDTGRRDFNVERNANNKD